MNVEKQNELRGFVNQEIVCCVTALVSELSSMPEFEKELSAVCSKQDPESRSNYIEAHEHWVVSDWLARQLELRGEMVIYCFYGLTIWGRCCTGQAVLMDSVIEEIYDDHF